MKHEIGSYVKTNTGRIGVVLAHSKRPKADDYWHNIEFPDGADMVTGKALKPASHEEIEKHTGNRT